ncbi:hypothetical protein MMC13_004072 [Lambiella insularis]|nr:hypothetical protein [Lambiella insularis]
MYPAKGAEQSPHSPLPSNSRGNVTITDCHPGLILFLKKPSLIPPPHLHACHLPLAGLQHPALVIRRQTHNPNHVLICPVRPPSPLSPSLPLTSPLQLTTFNSRSVVERFPHNRAARRRYLPIHPQRPTTPGGIQLRTADQPLHKAGYVNVGETYAVHTDMLRAYDYELPADRFRLTAASFAAVIHALGPRAGGPAAPALARGRGWDGVRASEEERARVREVRCKQYEPVDVQTPLLAGAARAVGSPQRFPTAAFRGHEDKRGTEDAWRPRRGIACFALLILLAAVAVVFTVWALRGAVRGHR